MISVIISVYNAANYIEKCIKSIQDQTYSELEIIAVDDGSTDLSGEICEKMALQDKRIVVLHKENGGNASARNAGIDYAHGEFITFVDSDDYIENNMYEEMLKWMENPQITIVSSGMIVRNIAGQDVISIASNPGIYSREKAMEDFFARRGNFTATACTKLIRRELFANGLRFNNDVIHEDTEAMPRFINEADHVYIMDRPFYHYIKRENSASTSRKFSMRGYHILDAMEEYELMCKENYPDILPQFYHYRLYTTYEMYMNLENCVDYKKYKKQAAKLRCQIIMDILKCSKWKEIHKRYSSVQMMSQAILGMHVVNKIFHI